MLRAGLFVDLYAVARQLLRASVERYSIRDLEQFYDYERATALRAASRNLHTVEHALELGRTGDVHVGTVDKFQGQEAPVVIYSMATSSPEDVPHGMEFLFSLNCFNVATSRAPCACILVANPRLFEPECRTPRQIQLANAFCRYLELAARIRSL